MIESLRRRIRAWKTYRQAVQFLNIAEQYERDSIYHRRLIRFHQEAEMHCRTMAKAAKLAAGRIA